MIFCTLAVSITVNGQQVICVGVKDTSVNDEKKQYQIWYWNFSDEMGALQTIAKSIIVKSRPSALYTINPSLIAVVYQSSSLGLLSFNDAALVESQFKAAEKKKRYVIINTQSAYLKWILE